MGTCFTVNDCVCFGNRIRGLLPRGRDLDGGKLRSVYRDRAREDPAELAWAGGDDRVHRNNCRHSSGADCLRNGCNPRGLRGEGGFADRPNRTSPGGVEVHEGKNLRRAPKVL